MHPVSTGNCGGKIPPEFELRAMGGQSLGLPPLPSEKYRNLVSKRVSRRG
jgi:hypothetical protein